MAWIFLNDAFFSIVSPKELTAREPLTPDLLVRARFKGDIERHFPGYTGRRSDPGRDYAFRCEIPREVVAEAFGAKVAGIRYHNFKGSIDDTAKGRRWWHDTCLSVWHVLKREQDRRFPRVRGKQAEMNWR